MITYTKILGHYYVIKSFAARSTGSCAYSSRVLPNLTKALNGPQIYIKRDDATGLATGGNKTRKLEFLIGDALAKVPHMYSLKVQLNLTMFAKRLQQPINLA